MQYRRSEKLSCLLPNLALGELNGFPLPSASAKYTEIPLYPNAHLLPETYLGLKRLNGQMQGGLLDSSLPLLREPIHSFSAQGVSLVCYFWDGVSVCSSGWSGSYCVEQVGLRDVPCSQSAVIRGGNHQTRREFLLFGGLVFVLFFLSPLFSSCYLFTYVFGINIWEQGSLV